MKTTFAYIILGSILMLGQISRAQSICSHLFSAARTQEQRVSDWVALRKEISKSIGFEIKLKTKTADGLVEIYAENSNGFKAIELTVGYSAHKKILSIEYIATDPYIKRGLAQNLIAAAFVLFENIEIIQVPSLVRDNESSLIDFLTRGYSLEEATKETPLYKALLRFGFSEIIPGTMNTEGGFAVRRK